jgi:hypothetical protein
VIPAVCSAARWITVDTPHSWADVEIAMTILFQAVWRLFLLAVCYWMFRPHWPVSGAAETLEGLAFLLFGALALLGQIGDRD